MDTCEHGDVILKTLFLVFFNVNKFISSNKIYNKINRALNI